MNHRPTRFKFIVILKAFPGGWRYRIARWVLNLYTVDPGSISSIIYTTLSDFSVNSKDVFLAPTTETNKLINIKAILRLIYVYVSFMNLYIIYA